MQSFLFILLKHLGLVRCRIKHISEKESNSKTWSYTRYINNLLKDFENCHNLKCKTEKYKHFKAADHKTTSDTQQKVHTALKNKWKVYKDVILQYWKKHVDLIKFLKTSNWDEYKWKKIDSNKNQNHLFLTNENYELVNHRFLDFKIYKKVHENEIVAVIAVHNKAIIKNKFRYGDGCLILKNSVIFTDVEIGNDVLIGRGCKISSYTIIRNNNIFLDNVKLENCVWVDSNNIFMSNLKIAVSLNENISNMYHHAFFYKPFTYENSHILYFGLCEILQKFKINVFIGNRNFFGNKIYINNFCFIANENFFGNCFKAYSFTYILSKNIFLKKNIIFGNIVFLENIVVSKGINIYNINACKNYSEICESYQYSAKKIFYIERFLFNYNLLYLGMFWNPYDYIFAIVFIIIKKYIEKLLNDDIMERLNLYKDLPEILENQSYSENKKILEFLEEIYIS